MKDCYTISMDSSGNKQKWAASVHHCIRKTKKTSEDQDSSPEPRPRWPRPRWPRPHHSSPRSGLSRTHSVSVMTYPKTSSAFFLLAFTSSWSSGTCIIFLRGSPYTRDAGGGATSLIQPATSATSSTDWVVSFFWTVTPTSLVRLCTFSSPTWRPPGAAAASSFRFLKDGAPLKEDLSRKARSLLRSCSPLGWRTQIKDKLRKVWTFFFLPHM